jgi:hypothetical protein
MVAGCEAEVAGGLLFPQAASIARMAGTAMRANGLKRISVLTEEFSSRAQPPISALASNTGKLRL